MKKAIYTLLLLTLTGSLYSQTWDGSTNTNWTTASNWSTNTVPGAGSTVVINNAALPNQPRLTGNVTVQQITISAGILNLNGFTLTVSNTTNFTGGTLQNGSYVTTSTINQMQNTTFNGPLTITKNGNSGGTMTFSGGNTFNGAVTIVNNGNTGMQLASTNADIFNGDMTFRQLDASGNLYPAYTGINYFNGNISTVGSVKQVIFGQGGGTAEITGNKVQNIQGATAQQPRFNKLVMNTTGNITLQVPITIGSTLTMTNGLLFASATNLVTINDNATTSGASNTSFVYGPVRKIGNEAFTFPTGKGDFYAPISISAPSNTSDHFTAEYFNVPTPHNLTLLSLGLHHVSKEEYWALNRTGGLSSVSVTLSYNAGERSGGISNLSDLRVSGWNGLLNLDLANGGTTGNIASGTVRTGSPALLYGDFTLASSSTANTMVLALIGKTMSFYSPTTSDNITWKFLNVRPGVDALVKITGSRNATLNRIDDSTVYNQLWQPFIRYTNTTNNATDSSYMEFKVSFVRNNITESQKAISMIVVDHDGSGSIGGFRELLKVSQPVVSKPIFGSLVTISQNASWMTLLSPTMVFPNIDTTATAAMSQLNFANLASYTIRVGVLGRINGGTVRQASFFFKNFASAPVLLPVKLLDLDAQYKGNDAKVSWATSEEENMNKFQVYRSLNGIDYTLVREVKAKGFSQETSNYSLIDLQIAAQANENVFYKLKMINNDGEFTWSSVVMLNKSKVPTSVLGTVYPNPTKGELNLGFENGISDITIQVVDMFGKVLQSYNDTDLDHNSSLTLDVSELSTGIYFIKVTGLDSASLTRFIKN